MYKYNYFTLSIIMQPPQLPFVCMFSNICNNFVRGDTLDSFISLTCSCSIHFNSIYFAFKCRSKQATNIAISKLAP